MLITRLSVDRDHLLLGLIFMLGIIGTEPTAASPHMRRGATKYKSAQSKVDMKYRCIKKLSHVVNFRNWNRPSDLLWVNFGLFWVPHLRRDGPPHIFGEPIMDGQANVSARRGGEATLVYISLV